MLLVLTKTPLRPQRLQLPRGIRMMRWVRSPGLPCGPEEVGGSASKEGGMQSGSGMRSVSQRGCAYCSTKVIDP